MPIIQKIAAMRAGLNIEKTGYDERQGYEFFRAEDVARGVRSAMVEHSVIHQTEILDWHEDNFYDQNGRNRPRITVKGRVTFVDAEDGSTFSTDAIATGSDTGGDKAARKYAVQLFKIAAIDLFTIVEDMGKFDSDGDREAEPVNMDKPAEPTLTAAQKKAAVGEYVKNGTHTADTLNAIGTRIAKELGQDETPKVWMKSDAVLTGLLKALQNGETE